MLITFRLLKLNPMQLKLKGALGVLELQLFEPILKKLAQSHRTATKRIVNNDERINQNSKSDVASFLHCWS